MENGWIAKLHNQNSKKRGNDLNQAEPVLKQKTRICSHFPQKVIWLNSALRQSNFWSVGSGNASINSQGRAKSSLGERHVYISSLSRSDLTPRRRHHPCKAKVIYKLWQAYGRFGEYIARLRLPESGCLFASDRSAQHLERPVTHLTLPTQGMQAQNIHQTCHEPVNP